MTPGLSKGLRAFGVIYDHTLSVLANNRIRHHATRKVGCQPGVCRWSHNFPHGVLWVCMVNTLSFLMVSGILMQLILNKHVTILSLTIYFTLKYILSTRPYAMRVEGCSLASLVFPHSLCLL